SDRLSLAARLPYVLKDWRVDGEGERHVGGLGDADVTLKYVLGRAGSGSGRHLWGMQAGTKLPTSSEHVDDAGSALDIDGQPGAGAWAPSAGAFYGYFRFPWMAYVSVVGTHPNAGYEGFHGGQALVLTARSQYALTTQWSAQLEFDLRHSRKNVESGEADPNSGGTLGFVAPGVVWSAV